MFLFFLVEKMEEMQKEGQVGVVVVKESSFSKIRRYIFYVVVVGASFKMIKRFFKI